MAIVKASYTLHGGVAKAAIRYIGSRPGKDGARIVRTLFTADGKVQQVEAYAMIAQADRSSYFYRLVISPDPREEDIDKALALRDLTEKTIRSVEDRFQQAVQWVAAVHDDHTGIRHVHAIAILPARLYEPDLQRMISAATEAAVAQHQRVLARQHQELSQYDLSW